MKSIAIVFALDRAAADRCAVRIRLHGADLGVGYVMRDANEYSFRPFALGIVAAVRPEVRLPSPIPINAVDVTHVEIVGAWLGPAEVSR